MKATERPTSWLLPALKWIRKRPAMYLRDDRLNSLACYVEGVIYGLESAGVNSTDDALFLKAFGKWLGNRLNSNTGDCWFYLLMCVPERTGHIDDFYRELDRYLQEAGFEGGLDDETFNLKEWGSRVDGTTTPTNQTA